MRVSSGELAAPAAGRPAAPLASHTNVPGPPMFAARWSLLPTALLLALQATAAAPPRKAQPMPHGPPQPAPEGKPQPAPRADFQARGPEAQANRVALYRITSPYQPGETLLRVLAPAHLEPPEKRRVLFILPVEPGAGTRWGDPVRAARAAGVARRFGFVALLPTFAQLPWYCDHPSDPTRRQESYVLHVLVPLAQRLFPHDPSRRALVGFSKSGWGAFGLLLRHPDTFGAAAAWDSPMMMARPGFGMGRIVGTQANFERYRIARLLAERAPRLRKAKRLVLMGYGNFQKDTQEAHALMTRLGIAHVYLPGPRRKHHWESGWLADAVEALAKILP